MCIICYKPKEVKKPTIEILEECFYNNPDGSGIAIMKNNHIEIKKGFMTFDSFLNANESVKDTDTAVYHFRIATSGGISKAMCHPFPITKSEAYLKSTTVNCASAFIHNGVIGKGSSTLSDTALYVKNTLSKIDGYLSEKALKEKIEKDTIGSRTVYMNAISKNVILTGNWIYEDSGLAFSNTSYKPYNPSPVYYGDDYNPLYVNGFCPECGCKARLISEFWQLYECEDCHTITDSQGYTVY